MLDGSELKTADCMECKCTQGTLHCCGQVFYYTLDEKFSEKDQLEMSSKTYLYAQ